MNIFTTLVLLFLSLNSSTLFAAQASGERWSVGAFGGIVTASEADLNMLITRANSRVGGISTAQLGNALEFGGYIQRRFNSSALALQLRPSYFTVSSTGSGTGGSYNYSLIGYGIMPMLRVYILEDKSIKLFIQGGVGWGMASGEIKEASATAKFDGSNTGYQAGIGVSFCFGARSQHCVFGEGNFRGLAIQRNTVSSTTGSFTSTGSNASLSQYGVGQELEIDNHDFQTTLSGVMGLAGYSYSF